ncbi:hypothetical protein ACFL0S_04805, partial [Thermodesulfobacteriota bacterium]
ATESDANAVASGLADYYAIPKHVTSQVSDGLAEYQFRAATGDLMDKIEMSGNNLLDMYQAGSAYVILVTDGSDRCPDEYKDTQHAGDPTSPDMTAEGWMNTGAGSYFRKIM